MEYPLFLGRRPDDGAIKWAEWEVQSWVSTQCHRSGLCFAASMEGSHKGKAGGAKAKATGQIAGEPDLRFYLPGGVCLFIELKVGDGKLSKAQIERHAALRERGFGVHVVYAQSPVHAWELIRVALMGAGMQLKGYYDGMAG